MSNPEFLAMEPRDDELARMEGVFGGLSSWA